ncbi:DNA-binding response regulator [Deinococcus aerolatus]|uniref:DNA-binding response regulator n=1 Tax=Deinococcus aerolatus TaxID=522487 RepID=A0ABQ2G8Z0_9DEIO|nr:response regulator transcription factor [Deinococcus aerolatus]GGL80990.1 DNA-binding response regulator [Deinococcus aerolatus]
MIRICIVEDQTLVRQGLRSMLALADDMTVVAEAENGEQALVTVPDACPDVLLLDYRMPRLDGLGVLRALAERAQAHGTPLIPTLILTTFDDDELLLSAVQLGAKGYLLKDVDLPVLLQAIRTVAGGGRWLQPTLTDQVQRGLDELRPQREDGPEDRILLTSREQEVLRLMAGGFNNREIAGLTTTTEGTIKGYVSNILSKLGVRDRTRAVLKAVECRLL